MKRALFLAFIAIIFRSECYYFGENPYSGLQQSCGPNCTNYTNSITSCNKGQTCVLNQAGLSIETCESGATCYANFGSFIGTCKSGSNCNATDSGSYIKSCKPGATCNIDVNAYIETCYWGATCNNYNNYQ